MHSEQNLELRSIVDGANLFQASSTTQIMAPKVFPQLFLELTFPTGQMATFKYYL